MRKRIARILLSVGLFLGPVLNVGIARAAADICTWSGLGLDSNWSTDANWSCSVDGAVAPTSGDSLVFPVGAMQTINTNDIVGLVLNSISIDGNGYTLSGSAITLTPASSTALYFNGNNTVFLIPTTISAGSSKSIFNQGTNNVFDATLAISLAGQTMNINTLTGSDITFNGVISGSMTTFLLNDDDGTVTFNAANTFTSSGYLTMFNDGAVVCATTGCLGNSSNLLYYFGSSSLSIDAGAVLANDIIVDSASTTPSMRFIGAGANYDGNMTVNQTLAVSVSNGVTDAEFNGDIDIASGESLNITGSGSYTNSSVTFNNGAISGLGDIAFSSVGAMMLGNNTTFSGDVFVNADALLTTYQPSLGTTTGETTVASGGVLRSASGSAETFAETIHLNGSGHTSGSYAGGAFINEGNAVDFTGELVLDADATIMSGNNLSGTDITISGTISGTGDLTLTKDHADSGDYVLSGTGTSTYDGTLRVLGATLDVQKSGGVGITGAVEVEANTIDDAMLIIANTAGNQIADDATVTLIEDATNDALFGSQKPAEIIGSLVGDGNFYVTGAGQGVTVGGGNVSGVFTGSFTNTSPSIITKVGTGEWDISGASYTGVAGQGPTIEVEEGTVTWGGSLEEINATIQNEGTLMGTGDAGSVTVEEGGVVNVGNSPGCMTVADLTLNDGATFTEEITGTTACTEYDQMTVSGTAVLGNATLQVELSETPAVGDEFTILEADLVTGTFDGLEDGATLGVNGVEFSIHYTATAVILTVTSIDALTATAADTDSSLAVTGSMAVGSILAGLLVISFVIGSYRTKESTLD
ncbi:MAG TPA: hypothetical protein PKD15_03205 [Candidatus Saccharibacteria bacterium]|jgi:hypothetical protein|nr:hypothetical protein [Candidatus Saccharibacteria bacterium]